MNVKIYQHSLFTKLIYNYFLLFKEILTFEPISCFIWLILLMYLAKKGRQLKRSLRYLNYYAI
jgi:hypothetical protein